MLKLARFFKPYLVLILSILALLLIQAMCDLALPDYMSRIVNNGIQQSGIVDAAPEVLREREMDKILLFMSADDANKVKDSYDLLDKSALNADEYAALSEKYPALEKERLYQRNTEDRDTVDALNVVMSRAMLAVAGIESMDPAELMQMMQQQGGGAPAQGMTPAQGNVDVFAILKMLPQEKRDVIRSEVSEKMDVLGDSMIQQAAVSQFVKPEYEAVGVDLGAMQSRLILETGAIMLLISLAGVAASVCVSYLAARVAAGFGRDVRRSLFTRVMTFSNNEIDKFSTASLITRTTNDIQQIQLLLVMFLRIVFYAPILGVGGSIRAINIGGTMAWIIAAAVGVILVFMLILFWLATPRFKRIQKLTDRLNMVMRQSLEGLPVVRAFNMQGTEEQKFDIQNREYLKVSLFVNRAMALMMPVLMLAMNGVSILIIWIGAHQVDAGNLQVGNLMALIQYAMQIIMSFLMISIVAIMMPRASVAAQRIAQVLRTGASIHDPEAPKDPPGDATVDFKNVTFKYPGAEEPVLTDISFTARPGETTAFIGSTGSGKSTLVNLVPRFYDVTGGSVTIGGIDIRELSQHALRDKIGYVPQKAVLFSGTIGSNLRYADEDAPEDVLKSAADIAQATEIINEKPEGFESEIAQGGTNVSGGQKQRLSIARAIVKRPKIYIFDDSFSALDYTTDAKLRKALKGVTADSVVLVVAQRIGTIMNAEQIIVLEEGRIVGKGTHRELLQTCGVYREIAETQMSKEELEK